MIILPMMFIRKHIKSLILVGQNRVYTVVNRETQMSKLLSNGLQDDNIFDCWVFQDIKLFSSTIAC